MLVAEILKSKGDDVVTVAPEETLQAAAMLLNARGIGAVVVCDGDRVAGVLSERDVVRAVAGEGAGALKRAVRDFMTADVLFAAPGETVGQLMTRMTDRRVRHLPVLRDGRLGGVVSIGDLVKCQIAEHAHEAETLRAYIVAG